MDCLAVNGQLVTIVPAETNTIASKLFLKSATLHYEFMGIPMVHNLNPERQAEILTTLGNLVEANLLKPHVSRTIKLEELPEGQYAGLRTRDEQNSGGGVVRLFVYLSSEMGTRDLLFQTKCSGVIQQV